MDGLRKGEQAWVITEPPNGLELRREPNMNLKTADGQDNVILSMPSGSLLVLESVEVSMNDGRDWYNIRYIQDDINEIGWAISDDLSIGVNSREAGLIPVTGAEEITEVVYKESRKFDVAYPQSEPSFIGQGLVLYKKGTKTMQTSLEEWNAVAGPYYQIT